MSMEEDIQNTTNAGGQLNDTCGIDVQAAEGFVYFCEAVVQPVILTFGLLTNTASLLVLQKVKLASTFRTCLIALAISDFCASCFGLTQILVEIICFGGSIPFGYWEPAAVASITLYFIFLMFMCTSNSIVIFVAVIRNFIVLKPLKARLYFSRNRTKWLCFGIFVVTFCIYAPTSLNVVWQSCYADNVTDICQRVNETITLATLETFVNRYLFAINIFYGPMLLCVYIACIVCIWFTLKRSTAALSRLTSMDEQNQSVTSNIMKTKRDRTSGRITRTLLKILILDFVCISPTVAYGCALLIKPRETVYDDSQIIYEVFDVIAEVFLTCKTSYNFWVYLYQHEEFREGLSSMFTGVRKTGTTIKVRCRSLLPSVHRKSYDFRNGKRTGHDSVPTDSGICMSEMHSYGDGHRISLPPRKLSKLMENISAESAESDSFMADKYE